MERMTRLPSKKLGGGSFALSSPVRIESAASAAGPFEKRGLLSGAFDLVFDDPYLGEKTWEKAEGALARKIVARLYEKSAFSPADTDFFFAGDLERQCMASTLGLLPYEIPYFGLYGACSTFAEGLILASSLLDGGFGDAAGVVTTSHFSTAEREYRTPLVYGKQRQPSAQHTVTGGGAVLLTTRP
ncbi:MAG: stage V sporulation protein AD, partial [Clostridia bacterium]|nr:stage V sporulation protein AD [Clostridia bacterium]